MVQTSRSQLFLCIAVRLLPTILGTHYPYSINGDDPCGDSYTVTKDALFTFVKYFRQLDSPNCTTTFQATNGAILVATFLDYSFDYSYINEKGNCSSEFIQLYNSSHSPLIGPGTGYCGSDMPTGHYVLGAEAQFTWNFKSSIVIITTTTVLVLLSEVVDKDGSCPSGHYDCQNNFCVSNDVTCNGYDDCGNYNDEIDACQPSPGAVAGIVVASVVLFPVLLYLICVLVIRYRRRH